MTTDIDNSTQTMAILQTTVMLVSIPFGYIGGLLSDLNRALPFVMTIVLLLLGILATASFYRGVRTVRQVK